MQNLMVVSIYLFQTDLIATLFDKFGRKNSNCQFKLKIGTNTNLDMKNSVVMFIFCVFQRKYSFLGNLLQKSKLFVETEIQDLHQFQYVEFDGNFHFFSSEIPFCVNLIQKFKRVILKRNLLPTLECLIDVPPPLINFFIFFHPEHSFFIPLSLAY